MDNQRGPLLSWAYYCQGKSMEELRQSLLVTTVELETTRQRAEEELQIRDDQILHLNHLLTKAITERDEAQHKCQSLLLQNLFLQQPQNQNQNQNFHPQQQQNFPISGISSIDHSNNGFSSSDCDESIVSSPVIDPIPLQEPEIPVELLEEKPLPEKGRLLQAVMKAGPLLQTLLLAGPLPQWRHPPPPLDSYQIPPPPLALPSPPPPAAATAQILNQEPLINIGSCGRVIRKRGHCEGTTESPTESSKYQRLVLH